jgi:hypothetical protein
MAEVLACRATAGYKLWLKFSDGLQGTVYLGGLLDIGAFKLLRNPAHFVDAEVQDHTVVWPVGARLDPDVLYMELLQNGAKPCQPTPLDPAFERFMQAALTKPRSRRTTQGKCRRS